MACGPWAGSARSRRARDAFSSSAVSTDIGVLSWTAAGSRGTDTPTGRGHLRRERSSSSPRRHHCAGRGEEIAARPASRKQSYLAEPPFYPVRQPLRPSGDLPGSLPADSADTTKGPGLRTGAFRSFCRLQAWYYKSCEVQASACSSSRLRVAFGSTWTPGPIVVEKTAFLM